MIYSLHIETSSTVCSVAIAKNNSLIDCIEVNNGFSHAENLHVFISEILLKNYISLKQLQFICISVGPGSYTGLRIGTSAAKGMAYALNIPIVQINTLQLLTAAVNKTETTFYCPFIDARRMEVYTAVFDNKCNFIEEAKALIVNEESITYFSKYNNLAFFGDGMLKCKTLLSSIKNVEFIDGILPSAKYMIELGFEKFNNKEFVNTAYFEPFYLKEFYSTSK